MAFQSAEAHRFTFSNISRTFGHKLCPKRKLVRVSNFVSNFNCIWLLIIFMPNTSVVCWGVFLNMLNPLNICSNKAINHNYWFNFCVTSKCPKCQTYRQSWIKCFRWICYIGEYFLFLAKPILEWLKRRRYRDIISIAQSSRRNGLARTDSQLFGQADEKVERAVADFGSFTPSLKTEGKKPVKQSI